MALSIKKPSGRIDEIKKANQEKPDEIDDRKNLRREIKENEPAHPILKEAHGDTLGHVSQGIFPGGEGTKLSQQHLHHHDSHHPCMNVSKPGVPNKIPAKETPEKDEGNWHNHSEDV